MRGTDLIRRIFMRPATSEANNRRPPYGYSCGDCDLWEQCCLKGSICVALEPQRQVAPEDRMVPAAAETYRARWPAELYA